MVGLLERKIVVYSIDLASKYIYDYIYNNIVSCCAISDCMRDLAISNIHTPLVINTEWYMWGKAMSNQCAYKLHTIIRL